MLRLCSKMGKPLRMKGMEIAATIVQNLLRRQKSSEKNTPHMKELKKRAELNRALIMKLLTYAAVHPKQCNILPLIVAKTLGKYMAIFVDCRVVS